MSNPVGIDRQTLRCNPLHHYESSAARTEFSSIAAEPADFSQRRSFNRCQRSGLIKTKKIAGSHAWNIRHRAHARPA
jgi:hypothetical protein